jgi:hypothetical protein
MLSRGTVTLKRASHSTFSLYTRPFRNIIVNTQAIFTQHLEAIYG